MKFKIVLAKDPTKYIEKLDDKWRNKIFDILEEMSVNPLSGDIETIKGKPGYYRRRIGRYRLKFRIIIQKREVRVTEFGPRGDFNY